MEGLGINLKTLIIQTVNFFILFLILLWLLYKPILKMLSDRQKKIEEAMQWAEKTKKESEELEEKIAKRFEQSKKDAKEIIEEAKQQSEQNRKEGMAKTQKEIQEIIDKSREQIEQDKTKMMQDLKEKTVSLVITATGKVLSKNLTKEDEKNLLNQTLREIKDK